MSSSFTKSLKCSQSDGPNLSHVHHATYCPHHYCEINLKYVSSLSSYAGILQTIKAVTCRPKTDTKFLARICKHGFCIWLRGLGSSAVSRFSCRNWPARWAFHGLHCSAVSAYTRRVITGSFATRFFPRRRPRVGLGGRSLPLGLRDSGDGRNLKYDGGAAVPM